MTGTSRDETLAHYISWLIVSLDFVHSKMILEITVVPKYQNSKREVFFKAVRPTVHTIREAVILTGWSLLHNLHFRDHTFHSFARAEKPSDILSVRTHFNQDSFRNPWYNMSTAQVWHAGVLRNGIVPGLITTRRVLSVSRRIGRLSCDTSSSCYPLNSNSCIGIFFVSLL